MKRYDMEGNEIRLGKLCSIEPEWAANRIEALEATLAALKKDARWLCKVHIEMAMSEWCEDLIKSDTESGKVVRRILEATKEEGK